MENRFYIKELDSYQKASDLSKERMGTNPNYDLELLPTKQMQEEMWEFLQYRGKNLVAEKFYTERRFYHHLCRMLKEKNNRPESFLDWDKEKWMQQMKIWLLQQGLSLTAPFKNKCGGRGTQRARTLGYIECLIDYLTDLRDADVNEITKDVWKIEKLDIQVKQDLIRPRKTISFTGISQPELKEEIKKAVYFQLRIESLETVKKELTAIRRFSRYLNEHKKNVKSCADFDRTIIEEYLVYMKTEDTGTKRYRSEITRLRSILNMVADIYQYPQAKDLILNRDIPPNIKAEFKVYSDAELKRFNEFLVKVDIQTARVMTIHQMLGTRISDTLTLRTDCLMEQNGVILIRIYQMKTHYYEKPISQELAALIREAMPFKSDKTVDEDYFILTLFALALEAKSRSITLSGKDIVLGVGLPPADFGQQAQGFKRYFMEHAKHGISFKFNGKAVNCYLKDTFVSPQNFAAVMCYKASLFKQYRTVNCIDIGEETVDLLVIRKGQPDLSVRVSDRSGMAILRSEISNVIQQNFGIHLESSDVEQVLMQEATILDEEVIREIKKMAEDWLQRIINKLHAYVPDFRTNPAVFLGGGSLLLKPQIEKSPEFKYIEFIEDVRANAVGYEKMTAMRLQKR